MKKSIVTLSVALFSSAFLLQAKGMDVETGPQSFHALKFIEEELKNPAVSELSYTQKLDHLTPLLDKGFGIDSTQDPSQVASHRDLEKITNLVYKAYVHELEKLSRNVALQVSLRKASNQYGIFKVGESVDAFTGYFLRKLRASGAAFEQEIKETPGLDWKTNYILNSQGPLPKSDEEIPAFLEVKYQEHLVKEGQDQQDKEQEAKAKRDADLLEFTSNAVRNVANDPRRRAARAHKTDWQIAFEKWKEAEEAKQKSLNNSNNPG